MNEISNNQVRMKFIIPIGKNTNKKEAEIIAELMDKYKEDNKDGKIEKINKNI